eukprot:GHVS01095496.1.p1 GENE.GHVS01095496.1~~GHVS01095496.1.p1  ORF type:complete len:1245 (-),score=273.99 GHVS01095496.1:162-3896(-)
MEQSQVEDLVVLLLSGVGDKASRVLEQYQQTSQCVTVWAGMLTKAHANMLLLPTATLGDDHSLAVFAAQALHRRLNRTISEQQLHDIQQTLTTGYPHELPPACTCQTVCVLLHMSVVVLERARGECGGGGGMPLVTQLCLVASCLILHCDDVYGWILHLLQSIIPSSNSSASLVYLELLTVLPEVLLPSCGRWPVSDERQRLVVSKLGTAFPLLLSAMTNILTSSTIPPRSVRCAHAWTVAAFDLTTPISSIFPLLPLFYRIATAPPDISTCSSALLALDTLIDLGERAAVHHWLPRMAFLLLHPPSTPALVGLVHLQRLLLFVHILHSLSTMGGGDVDCSSGDNRWRLVCACFTSFPDCASAILGSTSAADVLQLLTTSNRHHNTRHTSNNSSTTSTTNRSTANRSTANRSTTNRSTSSTAGDSRWHWMADHCGKEEGGGLLGGLLNGAVPLWGEDGFRLAQQLVRAQLRHILNVTSAMSCAAAGSLEVWKAMGEIWKERNSSWNDEMRALLSELIRELVWSLVKQSAFPRGFSSACTPDMIEELFAFRQDVRDLLRLMLPIGSAVAGQLPLYSLDEFLVDIASSLPSSDVPPSQGGGWEPVEAMVHALTAVAKPVMELESKHLQSLWDRLLSSEPPSDRGFLCTLVMAVSMFASWMTKHHPSCLRTAWCLSMRCMELPQYQADSLPLCAKQDHVAAIAIVRLAKACGHLLGDQLVPLANLFERLSVSSHLLDLSQPFPPQHLPPQSVLLLVAAWVDISSSCTTPDLSVAFLRRLLQWIDQLLWHQQPLSALSPRLCFLLAATDVLLSRSAGAQHSRALTQLGLAPHHLADSTPPFHTSTTATVTATSTAATTTATATATTAHALLECLWGEGMEILDRVARMAATHCSSVSSSLCSLWSGLVLPDLPPSMSNYPALMLRCISTALFLFQSSPNCSSPLVFFRNILQHFDHLGSKRTTTTTNSTAGAAGGAAGGGAAGGGGVVEAAAECDLLLLVRSIIASCAQTVKMAAAGAVQTTGDDDDPISLSMFSSFQELFLICRTCVEHASRLVPAMLSEDLLIIIFWILSHLDPSLPLPTALFTFLSNCSAQPQQQRYYFMSWLQQPLPPLILTMPPLIITMPPQIMTIPHPNISSSPHPPCCGLLLVGLLVEALRSGRAPSCAVGTVAEALAGLWRLVDSCGGSQDVDGWMVTLVGEQATAGLRRARGNVHPQAFKQELKKICGGKRKGEAKTVTQRHQQQQPIE